MDFSKYRPLIGRRCNKGLVVRVWVEVVTTPEGQRIKGHSLIVKRENSSGCSIHSSDRVQLLGDPLPDSYSEELIDFSRVDAALGRRVKTMRRKTPTGCSRDGNTVNAVSCVVLERTTPARILETLYRVALPGSVELVEYNRGDLTVK